MAILRFAVYIAEQAGRNGVGCAVTALLKRQIDVGDFFVFLNAYRWLNFVLAVILLTMGTVPKTTLSVTILVYGSTFVYNSIFTIWPTRIEQMLRKYPPLILIDILFCFFLLSAYGWRSPFTVYAFSPVMLAGYIYGIGGGLSAAVLSAAAYGLSVTINGYSWAGIRQMGQTDSHLFHYFDYFLIAVFFSYPVALSKKLAKSNAELLKAQGEIERLVLAKERKRLAGDIHDSVTQSLLCIDTILDDSIKKNTENVQLNKRLAVAKEAASKALEEIRSVIDDLFEEKFRLQPFCALAEDALQNVRSTHTLETELRYCGSEPELTPDIKKALYLIVQEALSNVIKHAHATRVDVNVDYKPHAVSIMIIDNGVGFAADEPKRKGRGLRMMADRAEGFGGFCSITSKKDRETRVTVVVPLPDQPAENINPASCSRSDQSSELKTSSLSQDK